MKDLPVRTLIAVLLIGLLCLVAWFGGWVQAAVLGLFTVAAVYEMFTIFVKRGIRPAVLPQILLGGSMFAVMYKFGARFILPMAAAAFVAIMVERILNARRTNEDLIASLALLVYPVSLLACFGLVGFGRNDISRAAFLCIFAGPCMADNTAYMVGSLFGKHKLCPYISPNKTVEGAVSGVVGGALLSILLKNSGDLTFLSLLLLQYASSRASLGSSEICLHPHSNAGQVLKITAIFSPATAA
jgi:phosphatidate cytidylyltransferase